MTVLMATDSQANNTKYARVRACVTVCVCVCVCVCVSVCMCAPCTRDRARVVQHTNPYICSRVRSRSLTHFRPTVGTLPAARLTVISASVAEVGGQR